MSTTRPELIAGPMPRNASPEKVEERNRESGPPVADEAWVVEVLPAGTDACRAGVVLAVEAGGADISRAPASASATLERASGGFMVPSGAGVDFTALREPEDGASRGDAVSHR